MMKRKLVTIVLAFAPVWALAEEPAAEPAADPSVLKIDLDPAAVIASKLPGVEASQIRPTPIAGVYEIGVGTNIAYVSADARYLLRGDLVDLESYVNLTERRRNGARTEQLAGLGEDKMIIFGPDAKSAKHEITVFSDIDCGYCRKLHQEMAQLNELGVRVRYVFYPRSGPDSASWKKAEDVWCADDRNGALTAAKAGQTVASKECGATPISEEWQMGQRFGVRGTPAIITSDGALIAGYLPAQQLVARLDNEKKVASTAKAN